MSKFDKMIERFTPESYNSILQLSNSIEELKEIGSVLQQAIDHYTELARLQDWKELSHTNAKESYESKLEKLNVLLKTMEERYARLQTKTVSNEV